ncbi:MAG: MFS transporter, partial [Spirochaetota bacterium]
IALTGESAASSLWILAFTFGAFTLPQYSVCLAYANDQLKPSEMVAASGAYIIFYGVGSSIGPLVSGMFVSFMGPSGLFALLALTHGGFAVWSILRVLARPSVRLAHKERFHPWPRTTATAFRMIRKVNRGGSTSAETV